MPGICGIVDCTPATHDVEGIIRAMLQGLVQEPWHVGQTRCAAAAGVALGNVALDAESQQQRMAWDEASSSGIVLDGELFDTASLAVELGRNGSELPRTDHARILLAGYRTSGQQFLRRLNGSFAAAIWDGRERQLTLITDRFGTRPVYFRSTEQSLRFASGLAALLAHDDSPRRISPRGLAQFFTFGHYLRDDTALADIHVLPAAARFVFHAAEGTLEPGTYWSLAEAPREVPASREALLDTIDDAFVAAVRRSTTDAPGLGLSLSGGLDARTILGVIDAQQTPLQTICLGMRGSLDHRSSAELSRLAGCSYHAHVLDAAFLENFPQHLERMVALTDGQYLSQCIVIPTLVVYRQLGIRTLLRGHAGELMHMHKAYNYSLDGAALQIRTDDDLREWLFGRLQAYLLDGVTEPLFAEPYQASLREQALESLDADLADAAHLGRPLDRIWHLFVSQRLRRETVLSMVKFRSVVEPRLPYLDNELIPLLLSAPPDLKLGEEIQTHILRRHRPEFLSVTNANTGARMGAAPWRARVASLQMRVLAKLGVPGYQPYERLGLWLRRELAPVVRDILLDPQTLDRGVYRPEGVRAVIKQHVEGTRNHTFLLMALMIFELGLRRLLDGRGSPRFAAQPLAQVA